MEKTPLPDGAVVATLGVCSILMFNISIAQISIWIWSNALNNSRGNQINIAQITILQLLFTNQIRSNQMLVSMRGKNRSTRGKTSHAWQSRETTNSIHIWNRVWKSNLGHIGGRQVLSPLGQPCHLHSTPIFPRKRESKLLLNISKSIVTQKYPSLNPSLGKLP